MSAPAAMSFVLPAFVDWRERARAWLRDGIPPAAASWRDDALPLGELPETLTSVAQGAATRVPVRFLRLAAAVACHRDADRWDLLYRIVWRITHGEPSLLQVATDLDVHRALQLEKAVRRASHKMKAFVRFRRVGDGEGNAEGARYVAWFEPMHHVVERTTPFFLRRFTALRWSILTPERCAHWDGREVRFTEGVSATSAPRDDSLEELWRDYYASVFNPARLMPRAMRAEMPKAYWHNLPEARLIAELTRDAPGRVARMIARVGREPLPLPDDLRAPTPVGDVPDRAAAVRRSAVRPARTALDIPSWNPSHDPGWEMARERERALPAASGRSITLGSVTVMPGVAGWTDPTLLVPGIFYPVDATTPEARLRYYAARYAMVEVDSTYYALPRREHAVAWVRRTPDTFLFNVKANALMTGHAADLRRLPDWLRRALPRHARDGARLYGSDVPEGVMDELWTRFLEALAPLADAGKLGAIFLQFPRWFEPNARAERWLHDAARRLGDIRGAVEFRNPAWVAAPERAERTFSMLESLGFAYTVVDTPPGTASSMPPVVRVTRPDFAVVRLHGRRSERWEARNEFVTERYRYLYDRRQLALWADGIAAMTERLRIGTVQLSFNNNHSNYATTNAAECGAMLRARVSKA